MQEEPGNRRYKVYYGLSCSAVLFTHYLGLFFLLPQFAAVALGHFREKRGILLAGLLGTLSLCPWLLLMRAGLSPTAVTPNLAWMGRPRWPDLPYFYMQIFGWLPFSGSARVLFVATAIVLLPLFLRRGKASGSSLALLTGLAVIPPTAAFLISHYGTVPIWASRQLVGSIIAIVCLLGAGVAAHRRALGLSLAGFLLMWSLFTLPTWFPSEMTPPWKPVAKALEEKCADCEIEVWNLPTQIALSYYAKQPVHSTARNATPADAHAALPYWLPNSPDRQHQPDRILFLCAQSRHDSLSYFLTDYQIEDQTQIVWGKQETNPSHKFEIYVLRRKR